MKLNIGSGYNKIEGYLSVDIDANCNPDFLFDIENHIWPFEDNSVDEVVLYHILEHIGDGYSKVIKELYRVCQNDAIVHIKVPHHRHDSFFYDPTHKRPIVGESFYLLSKQYNDFFIENNFTTTTLAYQWNVDFEIIRIENSMEEYYIEHLKDESDEYIQRYISEHNNVVKEVLIQLKVKK